MTLQGDVVVTGGSGYVGSHVLVELLEGGLDGVIVIDRLNEAKRECLRRIETITGKTIRAYDLDLNDSEGLRQIFRENVICYVIHLAAMKFHGESSRIPLTYYRSNICGFVNLLTIMEEFDVRNVVYASSFAVYGTLAHKRLPINENQNAGEHLKDAYSRTKFFSEEVLRDLCVSDKRWNVVILRFCNPIGAHKSGLIGEQMIEDPPNLMPNIVKTAMGQKKEFIIYGGKYDTKDGTGVRDYTHVVDIAKGHVSALKSIKDGTGYKIYNLAAGNPYSSLDVVKAFEKVSGRPIPYRFVEPRSYDIPASWADVSRANEELGWAAHLDLTDISSNKPDDVLDTFWLPAFSELNADNTEKNVPGTEPDIKMEGKRFNDSWNNC